eukprot:365003-Chlamydomonas_euryale.AAC.4
MARSRARVDGSAHVNAIFWPDLGMPSHNHFLQAFCISTAYSVQRCNTCNRCSGLCEPHYKGVALEPLQIMFGCTMVVQCNSRSRQPGLNHRKKSSFRQRLVDPLPLRSPAAATCQLERNFPHTPSVVTARTPCFVRAVLHARAFRGLPAHLQSNLSDCVARRADAGGWPTFP